VPNNLKGIPQIYNTVCNQISGEDFIEWIGNSASFVPGMLCETVAWYVKRDRWYLEEHEYKPTDEPKSTWYAQKLVGSSPPSPKINVMKYFWLEQDERLLTTNSKKRPVILLRRSVDTWWNPTNTTLHQNHWLCLPVFTYKNRHNQEYVKKDQMLEEPDRFYIPPFYSNKPGISEESAARYQAIQMVKEEHLEPMKLLCASANMQRPF
jgi:hypothetical protein